MIADLDGRSRRRPDGGYRSVVLYARSRVLLAAATAGKPARRRGPSGHPRPTRCGRRGCERVPRQGVRPPQPRGNYPGGLRPTAAELAWAHEVLATAETPRAVFQHAGQMIDAPVLAHAREVIAAHASTSTCGQ